jgi:hypothetical protein
MNESVALVAQILTVEYCKILEILPDSDALPLRESQAGYALLRRAPVDC